MQGYYWMEIVQIFRDVKIYIFSFVPLESKLLIYDLSFIKERVNLKNSKF